MTELKKAKEPTTATPTAPAPRMTKIEGVRIALQKLGNNANVNDIQAFVKKEFDIDMTKDHIYVSKGEVRKQAAKKGMPLSPRRVSTRKSKIKAPVQMHAASTSSAKETVKKEVVRVEDLQAVKSLLHRLGSPQLKSLIELLDK